MLGGGRTHEGTTAVSLPSRVLEKAMKPQGGTKDNFYIINTLFKTLFNTLIHCLVRCKYIAEEIAQYIVSYIFKSLNTSFNILCSNTLVNIWFDNV